MINDYFQKLEQLYRANACNQAYDLEIVVEEGQATVILTVTPNLLHGGGVMHGSYYFKVLDDAATFAVASLIQHEVPLTASFHIHFLRPVSTGKVTAVGTVIHQSRRLLTAEATAFDEDGRKVAFGSGSFMKANNQSLK